MLGFTADSTGDVTISTNSRMFLARGQIEKEREIAPRIMIACGVMQAKPPDYCAYLAAWCLGWALASANTAMEYERMMIDQTWLIQLWEVVQS